MKTRAMLAGTSAVKIPAAIKAKARSLSEDNILEKTAKNPAFDFDTHIDDMLRGPIVNAMIRSLYGLRSDRSEWTDVVDVRSKDKLAEERLYILVAKDNVKQLFDDWKKPEASTKTAEKKKMLSSAETLDNVVANPSRQAMLNDHKDEYEPTQSDIVKEMVRAAEEMAQPIHCEIYGYRPECRCLRS